MDALIFEMKGAHLALQRIGRVLLRRFGVTPARFDLMAALGQNGMKQAHLWRRLNVTRSVVCEMVRALLDLGWVTRHRAADSRTWIVRLTRRGRAIFERAYDACVESGDATLHADYALAGGKVEIDTLTARCEILGLCDEIQEALRVWPILRGPDLYMWRPEDFYFHLAS